MLLHMDQLSFVNFAPRQLTVTSRWLRLPQALGYPVTGHAHSQESQEYVEDDDDGHADQEAVVHM